ncbi:MAG: sulfotransferase domain-containing protein, partial [Myxococcales bacterium]
GERVVRRSMGRMRGTKLKKKAFKGYQPTEHDVFVATFAKSGTNWMMQIAQQISHRGDAEFEHIHAVVPWPDAFTPGPIALRDAGPMEDSPTGLRIIKTHLETEFVPYEEKATYLTVLRDPKEVLVSAYYFLGGMLGVLSHVTIDDWYELAIAPGGLIESWCIHAASFWDWRDRPNVLVLNFREVKRDPRRSIERVAAIMGVELTEAQQNKLIERASIDYMNAQESQFAPPQALFADKSKPTLMIRRGASGGSEELLSRRQQAGIDRVCQAELRKIGSDIPYAGEFGLSDR